MNRVLVTAIVVFVTVAISQQPAQSTQTGQQEEANALANSQASPQDKLKARDQLNQGVQNYKAGNYDKAIENFKGAVGLDPDLKTARLYLATAYMQQFVPGVETVENTAHAQQAIEEFQAVLSGDPSQSQKVTSLKGIASLYLNMRRLDESANYYKQAVNADPGDPEAYYSVGVIDWTAAYKDTAERKAKAGLTGVEAPMTGKKYQELCQEIKAADESKVDEGVKMLETATEKRQDYDDALVYMNLLYLRKADMACDDPLATGHYRKLSQDYTNQAMAARKKKFEEAAKKASGATVEQK